MLQCMVMTSTCGGGWQVVTQLDVCGQRGMAGQLGLGPEWRKLRTGGPGLLFGGERLERCGDNRRNSRGNEETGEP